MRLLIFFYLSISLSLLLSSLVDAGAVVSQTITVDPSGNGDFTSVQKAIDSIPAGNNQWIRIKLTAAIYQEQVIIPIEKEFIFLEGEGASNTTISWNDHATHPDSPQLALPSSSVTYEGATFSCFAPNFVARKITFENTFTGLPLRQAAAILVAGDKNAFYDCAFKGYQDTLFDYWGRHFFFNCFIEGAVDYIFGNGQSIYERCHLYTLGNPSNPGWVTAQSRSNPDDSSGFLFKFCTVGGTGMAYLGRPWGPYARVVFIGTYMDQSVVPTGWDIWANNLTFTYYAEHLCMGPGASLTSRTKWEKKLTPEDVQFYQDNSFIDGEGWLSGQP